MKLEAATFQFRTSAPEADGTLEWDATTVVAVEAHAGGQTGLGWTYSTGAAAAIVRDHLAPLVENLDPTATPGAWQAMHRACRNLGTRGLVAQAISAVDIALWDLKARLMGVPLVALFGRAREAVPVYGSGGFTSMSDDELKQEVKRWAAMGCTAMKLKIGESWGAVAERDLHRVRTVRKVAGDGVSLMVDANGAYTRGQARRVGAALDEMGVVWFEEPVSSDDIEGLRLVRDSVHCDVAAGEYASDVHDVALLGPVVDCLQLDVTRCGGYTGFLWGAAVASAQNLEVSAHCAPALHAPVAAAVPNLRHIEWFADHARLEPVLVDGAPTVHDGTVRPADTLGHGMSLRSDAWRCALN